jgi:hypothetical protein
MEAWRLKMEPWRVCIAVFADSDHFDEVNIRIRIKVKGWIRIHIEVKSWIWIRI